MHFFNLKVDFKIISDSSYRRKDVTEFIWFKRIGTNNLKVNRKYSYGVVPLKGQSSKQGNFSTV